MENNDNCGYPNSYFRYVPCNKLFDEMKCDSRADKGNNQITLQDHGPQPYTVNIAEATKQNNNFRTAFK